MLTTVLHRPLLHLMSKARLLSCLTQSASQCKCNLIDQDSAHALPHSLRREALTVNSAQRNRIQSPLLRLPAEVRNKIYAYTLELVPTEIWRWHHEELYFWDRMFFVRSSREVFAETAAAYFELRLLPYHCVTLSVVKLPPRRSGLVLPITPSQFRMLGALAFSWYHAVGLKSGKYCPFAHSGLRRLHISGAPEERIPRLLCEIRLRGWMENPRLKFTYTMYEDFGTPQWVPDA